MGREGDALKRMGRKNRRSTFRRLIKGLDIFDLPIAVYVVDIDGSVVACNRHFEAIVGADPRGVSFESLYSNRGSRQPLFAKLDECEKSNMPLQKEVLELTVGGKDVFVQDFSRSIRVGGHRIGLLCCMSDYTNEYRFQKLLEDLPAGVYQVDSRDRVVYGNDRFAQLHGFHSFDEVRGGLCTGTLC